MCLLVNMDGMGWDGMWQGWMGSLHSDRFGWTGIFFRGGAHEMGTHDSGLRKGGREGGDGED